MYLISKPLLVTTIKLKGISLIKTRVLNRRRPASIAGVKRRSSSSVAVVGAAPVLPPSPLEPDTAAKIHGMYVVPPSVVIRDAKRKFEMH